MDPDTLRRVMSGDTRELPPMGSQVVRIFTSSTFTDTVEERNMLMEEVYPKLRDYCRRKFGLDFQVVDMRWGVRDEATDDHTTAALCLEEIQNCQKMSTGPNFVTFLGQRHGSRFFPAVIPASELSILKKYLESEGNDVSLLDTWYRQDENALKPVYILQPISSQYPDFLSNDIESKRKAREKWSATHQQLQELLCRASEACAAQKLISEQAKQAYFMSVTEEEIQKGLFQVNGDPASQCLCFIRIIEDIMDNLSHNLVWRYIDMDGKQVNESAQNQLSTLRDQRLANRLNDDLIFRKKVKWHADGGINKSYHSDYLKQLSSNFHDSVVRLVDRAMNVNKNVTQNELLVEVLQHSKMAEARCAMFQGREDCLDRVKSSLFAENSQIVVVHGVSGSGKTSIMAKSASLIREWTGLDDCVVVTRFLGTTPNSSTIHATLHSICTQIAIAYENDKLKQCPVEFSALLEHFKDCLKLATKPKPLYVFLDSLDQLSSRNNAHNVTWLPYSLTANSKILVSTLTDMYKILPNLSKKVKQEHIIEISLLGDELGLEILNIWMKDIGRTLSAKQLEVVRNAVHICSLPLYVKLVFDQVQVWRSFTDIKNTDLSTSVRTIIFDLFERLERKHGSLLVKHVLGYITASRSGLSESEIEDILSIDDEVLTDVFQYHVPPTRRIPSILWIRIRHDISSYLVTREADGADVVYWYHRQFIEAANSKYVGSDASSTAEQLHTILADFFEGKWHQKKKGFTYTPYQMQKLKLTSSDGEADRRVASQPLYFELGSRKRYNLRKLNNLPFHMIMSKQKDRVKNMCFFAYDWLYAKLAASGIHNVLADLDMMTNDADSQILKKVLHLARSTLSVNPKTLGLEISGRLLPEVIHNHQRDCISKLILQCFSVACMDNSLVVTGQCYNSPSGDLQYYLEHESIPSGKKLIFLSESGERLCAVTRDNEIFVWGLEVGEFEKQITCLPKDYPRLNVMTIQGNKAVLSSAFQDDVNPVVVIRRDECEVEHCFNLEKVYKAVGFADNYKVNFLGDKLLVTVIGKEGDFFEIPTGKHIKGLGFPPSAICVLNDMSTVLVAHKHDSIVKVIDVKTMQPLQDISVPETAINIVESHTQEYVYICCEKVFSVFTFSIKQDRRNRNRRLFESGTIELKKYAKPGKKHVVHTLLSSPMGTYLVVYIPDTLIVWNTKKNRLHRQFDVEPVIISTNSTLKVPISGISIDQDDRFLFSTHEESLFVWSITSGHLLRVLRVEPSLKIDNIQVTSIKDQLSTSKEIVCTTCHRTSQIKVWNWEAVGEESVLPLQTEAACRYLFCGQDSPIALARSYDARETVVIDLDKAKILGRLAEDRDVAKIQITKSGKYGVLMEVNSATRVSVWDLVSLQLSCTIPVSPLTFRSCCTSNSDKYIATHCEVSLTEGVSVTVWNLKTAASVSEIKFDVGGFEKLQFADDDQLLILHQVYSRLEHNGRNCLIIVCNIETGEILHELDHVLISTVHVTHDSKLLLYVKCGSQEADDRLVTWTVSRKDGCHQIRETACLPAGKSLRFNSDGQKAVDAYGRVIDLVRGNIICQFSADFNKPVPLRPQITPDGNYVAWINMKEASLYVGRVGPDAEVIGTCFLHASPLSMILHKNDTVGVGMSDGRITLLKIVDPGNDEKASRKAVGIHDCYLDRQRMRSPATSGLDSDSYSGNLKKPRSAMCNLS